MVHWRPKRWWWCLLWLISDLVFAEKVEKCVLYPVEANTLSPKFPLSSSGDTILTINNIYNNNSWFYITTDNNVCVAQVLLDDTPPPRDIKCPVFHCNKASPGELLSVVVRRGEGHQTVQVWDCFTNEQDLLVNLTDSNTLQVASEEFINVAYDCPNRCYQFNNATIHKNFSSGHKGSLIFYGRAADSGATNWYFNILRGDKWSQNTYMKNFTGSNCWIIFQVEPQYNINNNNKLTMNVTIKYKTVSSCSSQLINDTTSRYVGNVPDKDVYIDFKISENVRWATRLCRPWEDTNMVTPGEDQQDLSTFESDNSHNGSPSPTSAANFGLTKEEWMSVATGFTCVSVVLLIVTLCLTVALCQRRHRQTGTSATPTNTTSVTHDVATDDYDPSSHFYETIDLDNLKVQLDKDKSESFMNLRQENGRRKSHTSINSLYGYIGPPSEDNSSVNQPAHNIVQ